MNNNKHINSYLQHAWNLYKEQNFKLIIELNCDGYSRDIIYKIEQYYLDNFCGKYNLSKFAYGGDNISLHPNNLNIRHKISIASKNRYKNMSIQDKRILRLKYLGKNNIMFGKQHSENTKKIISNKLKMFYLKNHILGNEFVLNPIPNTY